MADPELVDTLRAWYRAHRRELPWRAPDRTPWGVLVSEAMLQQTPVARVLPLWTAWMQRWPGPADLAGADTADVLRAWGRLGYPRRALALQRAARVLVAEHGGVVPSGEAALRALPGVGEYTAGAVQAFAFGRRAVVLDTNVRRVLTRVLEGRSRPGPAPTRAERQQAAELLPAEDGAAAEWAVAVMEFGALVCTAVNPRCQGCPLQRRCAWFGAGRPAPAGPTPRRQGFTGTDRQVRGLLMAVLREAPGTVPAARLDLVWSDRPQRERALAGLLEDGLAVADPGGGYRLPVG